MCKIDIHTHIMPDKTPDWVVRFGYDGFISLKPFDHCQADMMIGEKFFRRVAANCWDPVCRVDEMDATGVTRQVLSIIPVLFNYWARPSDGYDTSRFYNDYISGVCQASPDRFYGLGTLPMQDPDLACRELERCMLELGLQGIEIGSHINELNLNDPAFYPLYSLAEKLNACVFVHPWDMMGQERMERYWLPWLVGMPAETSLAICSMIFGGIFERFPKLRVAFAHGGGSFPITIGRIQHGYDVRPDLTAIDNQVSPREYLGKFWVDSLLHDTKALQYCLDLLGEEKIIFGSDYPFPLGDLTGGAWIDQAELPDVVKKRIFHTNALDWLGVVESTL